MHKKTFAAVGRTLVTGALVLGSTGSAWAASAPEYLLVNKSSEVLIDDATVKAVFGEIVSAKMARLYPTNKWGFGVQVEGGITQANTCVVTARVMLLQRNLPVTTRLLLFKPERMATTFDALPNASAAQCRDLAKAKLREASQALKSALTPE
ncbi:MAG: hypothetical protein IPG91_20730 [Ideonella sp.]|nr:hypothetical protein [Ideonella sp.]